MQRRWLLAMVVGTVLAAGSSGSAAPPRVVEAVPDNGDQNVDPSLREIRVTFDQDMSHDGYSWVGGGEAYPKTRGDARWVDGRTCVLPVILQPNHEYWLSINSNTFKNFRSKRGVPARPYPISFNTGPRKGAAKRKVGAQKRPAPERGKDEKLAFTLPDAGGREVRASDYAGVPVLLLSGACWCGGCQQDMQLFKELGDLFGARGLRLIRSVAGENELASLQFQKHYRLGAVHLLDATREFERQYHRKGWPFIMLTDTSGEVVFKANNTLVKEVRNLTPVLKEVMKSAPPADDVAQEGVRYRPATLKRSGELKKARQCDRFPSIACGKDGRVYIVFTSNRNGNNDVFLRMLDGDEWSADVPIAASEADEFDGAVMVDAQNRLWISWTSNAKGERYNIFLAFCASLAEPIQFSQLTDSDDDAMHARMTADRNGHIWATYYKWRKMGRYSRDKEVYVRRHDGTTWSDELQVTPTDVPDYEDHTDPVIAPFGKGVVVCWSWDFHRPKGYSQEAKEPTIFCRTVDANLKLGQARHVSGPQIDSTPAVTVDGEQRVWCAWESLGWDRQANANRKTVHAGLGNLAPKRAPKPAQLAGPHANVCGPSLAVRSDNTVALVWCERTADNQWTMKQAVLDPTTGRWAAPQTVEGKKDPRFPAIAYDAKGRLWIACSERTAAGREVTVTPLP